MLLTRLEPAWGSLAGSALWATSVAYRNTYQPKKMGRVHVDSSAQENGRGQRKNRTRLGRCNMEGSTDVFNHEAVGLWKAEFCPSVGTLP